MSYDSRNVAETVRFLTRRRVEKVFEECVVRESTGCWKWIGPRSRQGYGEIRVFGKVYRAHRLSYELHVGSIPELLAGERVEVLHSCDNPPCCNPAHLRLGSHRENVRDAVERGRIRPPRGVPRGMQFGETHHNASLTVEKVKSIRAAHTAGATQASLAALFGVDPAVVSTVVRRKSWRHV